MRCAASSWTPSTPSPVRHDPKLPTCDHMPWRPHARSRLGFGVILVFSQSQGEWLLNMEGLH